LGIKRLPTVFSLGSLIFEFQTFYILLSVGGSISPFNTPELIEKLLKFFRQNKIFYLNSAIVAFAGDARHRACSCSVLPQTLDNAADPVNAAIQQGN